MSLSGGIITQPLWIDSISFTLEMMFRTDAAP
jgi:hypothetical protein